MVRSAKCITHGIMYVVYEGSVFLNVKSGFLLSLFRSGFFSRLVGARNAMLSAIECESYMLVGRIRTLAIQASKIRYRT